MTTITLNLAEGANPVGTTGQQMDPNGVNHPVHYNMHPSGIEVIEVNRYLPANLAAAYKYMLRADLKEAVPIRDRRKALWYVDDQITFQADFLPIFMTYGFPSQVKQKLLTVINCEPNGYVKSFLVGILWYLDGRQVPGLLHMREAILQSIAHD